jgi:hypothetical protein
MCLEVPLPVVANLLVLGESFFLYLYCNDSICNMLTATLDNYLKYEDVHTLFVAVEVTDEVLIGLGVSIVPQLRYFRDGVECSKLHGTIDYEGLADFVKRY